VAVIDSINTAKGKEIKAGKGNWKETSPDVLTKFAGASPRAIDELPDRL